ncbi:carbohydrate sulfotransferase 14-like [Clavelina lepadiformis]|uniref:Carbohydrate sulfotransferase n=1 Tax=Clavelina lepadiformis TaxID=159417 RepID=A0ABP0FEQ8_CLALP
MRRYQKYFIILFIVPLPLFVFWAKRNSQCCLFQNSNTAITSKAVQDDDDNDLNLFYSEETDSIEQQIVLENNGPKLTHEAAETSVEKTCRNNPSLPTSLKQLSTKQRYILLSHLMVNDEYKFIYCYTPKVACSNWKKVVKRLYGTLRDEDLKNMDHKHGFKYLADYSDKEIEERLRTYYKFMFVRNPTERALSVYRNKFNEIESFYKVYGAKIMQLYHKESPTYKGKVPGDDVAFADFLRYIATGVNAESMNEHYMPMNLLCQPCVTKYSFIGIYENIDEDSKAVLEAIKAPEDVNFPERQGWYKPTTNSYMQYYFSLISTPLLKSFVEKYILDYEMFSFPQPYFVESNSTYENHEFHLL